VPNAGEVIHAKVHLQNALVEEVLGFCMKESMPLTAHLDELNLILMQHQDIDIKIKHEDATMVLLAFFPSSYENLVGSLSVEKDYITFEEVKSSLYTRVSFQRI